ncbi:MAG TPA: hypothetical protein VHX39_14945 [Acetobacteraceae bacterium]|nr:hypothetical protein [Acetobacteraceae bacterium]
MLEGAIKTVWIKPGIAGCITLSAVLGALALVPAARAAEIGSLPPAYAPGGTIGIAKGALPPAGLYWEQTSAYANLQAVNGEGERTGAATNAYFTISTFVWSTDYYLLGARYSAFIANAGLYNLSLRTAQGSVSSTTSLGDVEPRPSPALRTIPRPFSSA